MSTGLTGTAAISDVFDSMPDEGGEPEPEQTPSQPEQTTVETQTEPDEGDDIVTAEDLAAIRADPRLSKVHKNMLRGWTQKTQSLAEERKLIEAQKQFFEWVEKDPAGVAKVLAASTGLTIQEAKQTVAEADDPDKLIEDLVGPQAAPQLKKILDLRDERRFSKVNQFIEQMQAKTKADEDAKNRQQVFSATAEWKAEQKENGQEISPEIEQEMGAYIMELTSRGFKVPRGADGKPTLTESEFLDLVYSKVSAKHAATAASQQVADRIRKAAGAVEPTKGIRTPKETETGVSTKKRFGDNFDAAWDEADREVRRR